MPKRLIHICLMLAILGIGVIKAGPSSAGANVLDVLSTHLPLRSMAGHIAGGRARVSVLIPPGTDLHAFSLRPGDMKALLGADLMLMNGAGLEAGLERGIERAKNRVDTSEGLDLITSDHGTNPHIWLSPMMAAHQAGRIMQALIHADPGGRETYQRNAAGLGTMLTGLDSYARERLAPFRGMPLITYHGSFDYLALAYGLEPYSLTGPHGETPLPGRLRKVYDLVRATGVAAVFAEESFPPGTLMMLSRDLGVRVCYLDSLISGYEGAEGYMGGMRKNIETISGCLLADGKEKTDE